MKGKSTKSSRLRLANRLNKHLLSFGDMYQGVVVCPTCLSELNLARDQSKFSAGHILPEAVGGNEWTFLCRSCNSKFGEKQDKWFGEYLDILYQPQGTLLHAKTKGRYISINGNNIVADINISPSNDGFDILLPVDRNPPEKVKNLSLGSEIEFRVKIPLLEHENEIEVGYITAAYLYWFQEIGYNWIFQSSLDIVRKQIIECDGKLDGAMVVDLDTDKMENQGIGIVNQNGTSYPCCVVIDKLVIFPPPSILAAVTPKKQKFHSRCEIKFLSLKILDVPYLVLYDGCHIIVPDRVRKHQPIPEFLLYIHSDQNREAQWLRLQESNITRR